MGRLGDIFFALSNPNRIKIYDLVLKKRMNITQISEAIPMSYKSTLHNLDVLEKAELIKKTKEVTSKAQETFIEGIPLKEETVYYDVYKKIKQDEFENK